MWEAWTGAPAHARLTFAEVFAQVVVHQARPAVPPNMPPSLALLMSSCWDQDPARRPDIQTCAACLNDRLAVLAAKGGAAAPAPVSASALVGVAGLGGEAPVIRLGTLSYPDERR